VFEGKRDERIEEPIKKIKDLIKKDDSVFEDSQINPLPPKIEAKVWQKVTQHSRGLLN
jgi:hypothetical protein